MPTSGGSGGSGSEPKAGDILNFLPVAAAAAAAAAVAANGNSNFLLSMADIQNNNGYHAVMNGHESDGHVLLDHELSNGHDINATSELLNAAAKLLTGTAAAAGAGAASLTGSPGSGGGGGGGAAAAAALSKDPSVSTTQVTIPKDVSSFDRFCFRQFRILTGFVLHFMFRRCFIAVGRSDNWKVRLAYPEDSLRVERFHHNR